MNEKTPAARLLQQLTADSANLRGIVIGYVRNDGTAGVRYTPLSPAELAHLARMLDTKIDREYSEMLFPPVTSPLSPPSMHSKPKQPESVKPGARKKAAGRRGVEL